MRTIRILFCAVALLFVQGPTNTLFASCQAPDSPELEIQKLNQDLAGRFMKLKLQPGGGAKATLPARLTGGLSVRLLAPWRGGILVAEEAWEPGKNNYPIRLNPYWLDQEKDTLHPVQVKGVDGILDIAVAGSQAYVLGTKGKQLLLLRLDGDAALPVVPPEKLEAVRLGRDGGQLLVLHGPRAWRLEGKTWKSIPAFNGYWRDKKPEEFFDEMSPGFPPEHILGRLVYWQAHLDRNTGSLPNPEGKQAWGDWFDGLGVNDQLARLLGDHWSITPTVDGSVWIASGSEQGEHLKRVRPGKSCEVAYMFGDPAFVMQKDGLPKEWKPKVTASSMAVRPDGSLLLFGRTGIFELGQGVIRPLLSLENTEQTLDLSQGKDKLIWRWDPGRVLAVGPGQWIAGGTWGGIYRFSLDDQGKWSVRCLDDTIAAPLAFQLKQ